MSPPHPSPDDEQSQPAALPPGVLFAGVYGTRAAGFQWLAAGILIMAAFVLLAARLTRSLDGAGSVLIAAPLIGLSAYLFRQWLLNHTVTVQITTRGIVNQNTFTPWNQVAHFGASIESGGEIWPEWAKKGGILTYPLATTPPLSDEDWQRLVDAIENSVLPKHPQLLVQREPRIATTP